MVDPIELSQKYDLVLIDTCSATGKSDLSKKIKSSKYSSEIPSEIIAEEIYYNQLFRAALKQHNVRTIPEVTQEFYDFLRGPLKIGLEHLAFDKDDLFLHLLVESAINNFFESRDHEVKINSPLYERFVNLFKQNCQHYGVYDRVIKRALDRGKKGPTWEKDTDERLIVTGYCASLAKRRTAIVTMDGLIFDYFLLGTKCLGSTEFLPNNLGFRNAIKNYPIDLYYGSMENLEFKISSADIHFSKSLRGNRKLRKKRSETFRFFRSIA